MPNRSAAGSNQRRQLVGRFQGLPEQPVRTAMFLTRVTRMRSFSRLALRLFR